MKVLIQDTESGKYFAAGGVWTPNACDAKDFCSQAEAGAVAERCEIMHLRVILYHEELNYTIQARRWRNHRNGHSFGNRLPGSN